MSILRNTSVDSDTAVVYHSDEDNCWIAHSLRTDQIGSGEKIVEALSDLLCAVDQVRQIAEEDPSVDFYRQAPAQIQQKAHHAKSLPQEFYEAACHIAVGQC